MSYWNGSRGWQKSPHWKCKKPPTLFMRFWCFEVGLRMKIGQYDIYVYNIIVYNYIQNHIIYNIIIYYMNTNHFEASWNDSVAMCSDASAPAASISVQGTLKSWTSGSNMPRLLIEADCRREHLRSGELKAGGVSACQNVLWRNADKCSAILFFFRKSGFCSLSKRTKLITFDCRKKGGQLSACCRREASSIFNVFSPGIAWTLTPKSSGNCGGFLKWGYPMVPPNQSF